MKKINAFILTLIVSIAALAEVKSIFLDQENSILKIEASTEDEVSWTIENVVFNPDHPEYTTEALRLNFTVIRPGCGWFNEKSSLIQVESKQKIEFFSVEKIGDGFSCVGTEDNRRKFSFDILLARYGSNPIQIAGKLQLTIVRKENPNGPGLKPVFDHIELIKLP